MLTRPSLPICAYAQKYVVNPEYVKSKYNLPALREVENLVAEAVQVSFPFFPSLPVCPSFRSLDLSQVLLATRDRRTPCRVAV